VVGRKFRAEGCGWAGWWLEGGSLGKRKFARQGVDYLVDFHGVYCFEMLLHWIDFFSLAKYTDFIG